MRQSYPGNRARPRRRWLETRRCNPRISPGPRLSSSWFSAGFGRSSKQAARDALTVALAIVNGAMRVAGVLLPVSLLLGVPVWLLIRTWRRRREWRTAA